MFWGLHVVLDPGLGIFELAEWLDGMSLEVLGDLAAVVGLVDHPPVIIVGLQVGSLIAGHAAVVAG